MNIFLQIGIKSDGKIQYNGKEFFYIEEFERPIDPYNYPGDSIKYVLDGALVMLYDTFRDFLFEDIDQYYSESYNLPIFAVSAGNTSDCVVSVDKFNQWVEQKAFGCIPHFYKHLYLQDCQAMISTIQNLLSGMEYSFISYYTMIPEVDLIHMSCDDGIYTCSSAKVRVISSLLENYFTKAYSIMDMICKILFEFQKPQMDFTKYQKLKSAKKLWGDRKHLALDDYPDTVFDKSETVSMIESLRNEVVHNGSWEQTPKMFLKVENRQIIERFMMFPDIAQGRLCSSKNRKHFFSKGTKVNEVLPEIHSEFKRRLLRTVEIMNSKY